MKQIRTTIESPYEPNDNGALWLDTSNPDAPILKAFTNGKWQATIGGEKVTEISGDSTDEEIPTAKAVNDRVTELADAVGVDLDKYKEYFTIEATVDDTTIYFYRSNYGQDRGDYTVEVSIDGGATWVSKTATLYEDGGTVIANIDAGDKVLIRGTNQEYGGYDEDMGEFLNFANFWADGPCYVYGNIMSLIGGDDFAGLKSMENRGFSYFFLDYDGNYGGSWVLSKDGAELLLPATILTDYCYNYMFSSCTSLTTAPALPATTLSEGCYEYMFHGCTLLTASPALPATTLADGCYTAMFQNCTSLTSAPMLPATTLAARCYSTMFYGCTSLTSAPELPATTLTGSCYDYMFNGCSNLSYIKALFTATPGDHYTYKWVSGVNATGTFVKNSTAGWNSTGEHSIPTGWTVVERVPSGLRSGVTVLAIDNTVEGTLQDCLDEMSIEGQPVSFQDIQGLSLINGPIVVILQGMEFAVTSILRSSLGAIYIYGGYCSISNDVEESVDIQLWPNEGYTSFIAFHEI